MTNEENLDDKVERNHHYRPDESPENWQIEGSEEKVTKKFIFLGVLPICLVFILIILYLLVYINAKQQLKQDYSWVSAGFALAPTDT
ncbi:hypothetical protein ABTN61_19615, partial [Acinetobacter baumannii]